MGFVDNDLAEIMNRCKKGGARADDDERVVLGGVAMNAEPGLAAFDHSEIRMHDDNAFTEGFFKDVD